MVADETTQGQSVESQERSSIGGNPEFHMGQRRISQKTGGWGGGGGDQSQEEGCRCVISGKSGKSELPVGKRHPKCESC